MPSYEVMLTLGVFGFYLFDSALMLKDNEVVFIETRGQWRFVFPKPAWQMLGDFVYFPNPVIPESPIFRCGWLAIGDKKYHITKNADTDFFNVLRPMRIMVMYLFGLFVFFPITLFTLGIGIELFMIVGCIYIVIILMLVYTYRMREYLGLNANMYAKLAFDSIACPPFALNLIRKITLNCQGIDDPIAFAQKNFDISTVHKLSEFLESRLDEELEYEDADSPRYLRLKSHRNRIASMHT
jgi:hypothetical protein